MGESPKIGTGKDERHKEIKKTIGTQLQCILHIAKPIHMRCESHLWRAGRAPSGRTRHEISRIIIQKWTIEMGGAI